jgi:hypothetical protein
VSSVEGVHRPDKVGNFELALSSNQNIFLFNVQMDSMFLMKVDQSSSQV